MTHQLYAWAAGFNSAGSLKNIETDVPFYQGHPLIVQGRGHFNDGELFARADKLNTLAGFLGTFWLAPVMGLNQYAYIQTNYTVGGTSYSGKMTITTRKTSDTFANYSAVLILPQPHTLERKQDAFLNVKLEFIIEAAL